MTLSLPKHKSKVVLKELEEMRLIEESPTAWCWSIVLGMKKDGSIRFCADCLIAECLPYVLGS